MSLASCWAHLDESKGCAWWQGLVLVGLLVPCVFLLALLQVELVLLLQVEDGSGGHSNDQCCAGVFLQDREERGVREQQRRSLWSRGEHRAPTRVVGLGAGGITPVSWFLMLEVPHPVTLQATKDGADSCETLTCLISATCSKDSSHRGDCFIILLFVGRV